MPAAKSSLDPFAALREAALAHRAEHGCGEYPYDNGALLSTLAAAANARRVLELGTALGSTALCFARGAPDAVIDTIERDAEHVLLARGLLISANLTHGGAEAYLAALQDKKTWLTAFIDEDHETALTIKL